MMDNFAHLGTSDFRKPLDTHTAGLGANLGPLTLTLAPTLYRTIGMPMCTPGNIMHCHSSGDLDNDGYISRQENQRKLTHGHLLPQLHRFRAVLKNLDYIGETVFLHHSASMLRHVCVLHSVHLSSSKALWSVR